MQENGIDTVSERQRGLGRGLSALLGEQIGESVSVSGGPTPGGVLMAPVESLKPNPDQPRKQFDAAELDELAASIRDKGVLLPILVRAQPGEDGMWQIIAGERRWRAAQIARLTEVPIIDRPMDDLEVLPEAVLEHVTAGRLSAGHARALITAPDPAALAEQVLAQGLNVRQAEALARQAAAGPKPARVGAERDTGGSADVAALEQDLADALGLKVQLVDRRGKGELTIRYASLEQLDDLCRRLMRS